MQTSPSQFSPMAGRAKRARASSPTPSDEPDDNASTTDAATENRRRIAFEKRYNVKDKSDEEVLDAQMKNWRSDVYDHFVSPPTIVRNGDVVDYFFTCKKDKSARRVKRVRHDDSTSNLSRHIKYKCKVKRAKDQSTVDSFVNGSTYDKAKFRYHLTLWVTRRHRPFAIVEDPELVFLFQMLFADVDIPSRITISRDVKEVFELTKAHVSNLLKDYPGYLHLGIDGWTSPNVFSFLGITVQRFHEGKISSFILDFIKLTNSHTGVYLATKLAECLEEYGIEKKILSVVADNAGNNDTLVTELESLLPDAPFTSECRIRCMGHIINLTVKAILSQFTKSKKSKKSTDDDESDEVADDLEEDVADDDDECDMMEVDEVVDGDDAEATANANAADVDEEFDDDREASDAAVISNISDEVDATHYVSEADRTLAQYAMTKILALAKRVFHSPLLREELKKICVKIKIDYKILMRAVPTRWNSVTVALDRALHLQPALDKLTVMDQFNTSRGTKLKKYKLSKDEWDVLKQLNPILQHFLEATNRISRSSVPLLHEVIPIIDVLTDTLDKAAANTALLPAVRSAMARGRKILDKYYGKTDESIMYRCAMLLHPRYKLSYFQKLEWEVTWIDTAIALLRQQWETLYKPRMRQSASTSMSSTAAARSVFDDIDAYGMDDQGDPLDMWLSTPPIKTLDPLAWWGALRNDNNPLAEMAIDFLSAPAASTDVERAFSRGGLTVSKYRHSLSDESTRAATVLSSWAEIGGLIPEAEAIEMFRAKASRLKE